MYVRCVCVSVPGLRLLAGGAAPPTVPRLFTVCSRSVLCVHGLFTVCSKHKYRTSLTIKLKYRTSLSVLSLSINIAKLAIVKLAIAKLINPLWIPRLIQALARQVALTYQQVAHAGHSQAASH